MPRYPELQTLDAWLAASDGRRTDIANEIARDHGLELEQIAPFRRSDLPLASYRGLDRLFRFVLVPGGSFEVGLGDEELATLEAAAEAHTGEPDYEEEWLSLLAAQSPMRPTRRHTVRPILIAQNTVGGFMASSWRQEIGDLFMGEGADVSSLPADLEEGLRQFGYRLPWEAEWEWCARGGRQGELTFKGNAVPDAAYLMEISKELRKSENPDAPDRHAGLANDFGLLGFGVDAEVCRDRYRPDLGGPAESSPDIDSRSVRGSAGATYPWQNPGEWHALLTAYRARCGGLKYAIGVRLVRDVEGED